ncbi:Terpenoid cyclases/protein prenyltransferase alpha-alpha toroid [Forsythia ovata]|uniref:Terpenoid cyclases/protein prenyltransferase alpha-alpha toroid n=1 Tax=Forsythia ovata TaxID=205694 RepID=A0ABD1UVJ4_9LAMI
MICNSNWGIFKEIENEAILKWFQTMRPQRMQSILRASLRNYCMNLNYHEISTMQKKQDILAHEEQERQRLKEEVKKLLAATPDYSLHKLDLIDAIQRLGMKNLVRAYFKEAKWTFDGYVPTIEE